MERSRMSSHPANPTMGLNLSGMNTYGNGFQTLNLMRQSDGWSLVNTSNGWSATRNYDKALLDEYGWPKEMVTVNGQTQVWSSGVTYSDRLPPGQYVVTWKGEGEFYTFKDVVQTGDHRIVIDVKDDPAAVLDGFGITIYNTDPNKTGDYLRDFEVYRLQDEALVKAGEIWRPEYLDKVGDFRVLRTMDLQQTNSNPITSWNDAQQSAKRGGWTIDAAGAPMEALVDLANKTNADLWISIPHLADDAYVRKAAQYIKDHLDPELKVYVEYSNEHWTWIFGQRQYFDAQGKAKYGDVAWAGTQFYIERAGEIMELFGQEFGAANDARYVPLLTVPGGASAYPTFVDAVVNGPDIVRTGGTAAKDGPFKAIAIDTYWDGGASWSEANVNTIKSWIADNPVTAKDKLFAAIFTGKGLPDPISIAEFTKHLKGWGDVAKGQGWELLSYEGGTGFANFNGAGDAYTKLMLDMNRDPRIVQMSQMIIDAFKSVGGTINAHFADFGTEGYYGNWSIWDSGFAANPNPRGEAVVGTNNQTPWYSDPRPGDTFLDDRLRGADKVLKGSEGWDDLSGGAGNDTLYGFGREDSLKGAGGNDKLFGGDGGDTLQGEDGHDRLDGAAGDDILDGGTGDDALSGGAGRDGLYGGAGNDRLAGGDGGDEAHGGEGNDVLAGHAGDDRLDGGEGQDSLSGGGGNDFLLGGGGKDILIAGSGDDRIDGQWGDDVLRGEAGRDVFVFDRWSGADRIVDFRPGEDQLDFRAFAAFGGPTSAADSRFSMTDTAVGVKIAFSGLFTEIVLSKVTAAELGASDFMW
jgi:hypothetical protein